MAMNRIFWQKWLHNCLVVQSNKRSGLKICARTDFCNLLPQGFAQFALLSNFDITRTLYDHLLRKMKSLTLSPLTMSMYKTYGKTYAAHHTKMYWKTYAAH